MLPEHVALLKEMWQEDIKVQKPEIDAQEIELMNQKLHCAYCYEEAVHLSVYKNGEIVTIAGNISKVSTSSGTLQIENDLEYRTIPFKDIIKVSSFND